MKDDSSHDPPVDRAILSRVLGEARGHRRHILAIFGLSLLATPLTLLMPVPLAIAVDNVIGEKRLPGILETLLPGWFIASGSRILLFAVLMQVAVVVLVQIQFLVQYLLETYTGEHITLRVRSRLLAHAQRLSFSYHDRKGTADSIYRITQDASAIQHLAIYGVIPFIGAALTLGSMIFVIFRIDPRLAIVALAISPLLYAYNHLYKLRMRRRYTLARELDSSALSVVQEVLTSHRVVTAFGREKAEERRFTEKSTEGMLARVRLVAAEGAFEVLVQLTTAIGTAVVLYIGVRGVQAERLTLGELLLVMTYLTQLYGPLKEISRQLMSLQGQLASAQRVFELLDEVPAVRERPGAVPLERAVGHIELDGVSFSYDGEHEVLRELSLDIAPGAQLGIVGRTGAGKTTLVSLLTRFYDPTRGRICLDGIDLRDYRLDDVRSQFAIVLQEPLLLSTSIAENIAYARPDASLDSIIAAARAAGAHEFISTLPDGYDTVVDERGMRLSGGERQRVSLARAFLKDAPILVLDEPTSSVDSETEASIMEAMQRLMDGRTTLMIAHRLSTLSTCDALLRIEDGRATLELPDQEPAPHIEPEPDGFVGIEQMEPAVRGT